MFFGARFFRIRGSDVRSAIVCFDFGVQKYRTDSQLSLSNQSTATSGQWEAEGPHIGTSVYVFFSEDPIVLGGPNMKAVVQDFAHQQW